mmetsp:Transcript_18904/g.58937  ORF Transcript_18904/g.58937 Transcript_18904/m.58937 type:complete len:249 (-) Transcript_18904:36-782(-)
MATTCRRRRWPRRSRRPSHRSTPSRCARLTSFDVLPRLRACARAPAAARRSSARATPPPWLRSDRGRARLSRRARPGPPLHAYLCSFRLGRATQALRRGGRLVASVGACEPNALRVHATPHTDTFRSPCRLAQTSPVFFLNKSSRGGGCQQTTRALADAARAHPVVRVLEARDVHANALPVEPAVAQVARDHRLRELARIPQLLAAIAHAQLRRLSRTDSHGVVLVCAQQLARGELARFDGAVHALRA